MNDMKDFEWKLHINSKAFEQVKKFIEAFNPHHVSVGVSTAFTVRFNMEWGSDFLNNYNIAVEIESWGKFQGIFINGHHMNGSREPQVKMEITDDNLDLIYKECVKLYNRIKIKED